MHRQLMYIPYTLILSSWLSISRNSVSAQFTAGQGLARDWGRTPQVEETSSHC